MEGTDARPDGLLRVGRARIAVIGAGIAGLAAAVDLAGAGFEVHVLERAASPGGKMREVSIAGRAMDAGPTVFTLPAVFESLFADAGDDFARRIRLVPAGVLARHKWQLGKHLDLHADLERSADAIGSFAGKRDAEGFLCFAAQAQRIFRTLDHTFMQRSRPSPAALMRRVGFGNWSDMWNIQPFRTLWRSTARYFRDPRLRQMFARYATYCGSSPFAAPATLMLIAHVEQAGVWYVDGGMYQLALQLAALAVRKGAVIRYESAVRKIELKNGGVRAIELFNGERTEVDAIVCNADNNALAAGLFGAEARGCVRATPRRARSLSALTWNLLAHVQGFDLAHHSVFFCEDYRAEFHDIFHHQRLPSDPTIYVCAQDRYDTALPAADTALPGAPSVERLLCLINAPPTGDTHFFDSVEIDACASRVFQKLRTFGVQLSIQPHARMATTPTDFNRLFPATGGALYGPASHGWMASFKRAGSRSAIRGLYLAGGSTHPGPGVPMAAISGRLAAACIAADRASTGRSSRTVMLGGMSMP